MPHDRNTMFLEGPIGRALVRLAIPIILGNLLQTGYQLTDAFWVGRLGAAAVAAVSISFPVTFLVIALGAGLGIAGATLSAQYVGAGRQDLVNHVAAQTMMMVTVTSAVLGAAGYTLAPLLLDVLGVAPDVHAGALGFMRVSFVGIIFVLVYAMFQALMRGVGETRTPAGRSLLIEQFRILTSQVPVLYGVLVIDSTSIACVLPPSLSWSLRRRW